jgi:ABC-type amino acid transport substrate-binding protein
MLRTLLLLAFAFAAHAQPLDGRLKRIAETKTINVGVRADAMPFSFIMAGGAPEGFMIDLCQRVVRSIASQLKLPELKVNWVLVTVQSRFDVVAKGNADMECGSSTITLSRMRQVDFSSITFVESTGVLSRPRPARASSPTWPADESA